MATDHNFKVKNGLTVQGTTLVVNSTESLSGTQVYIKKLDANTNLQRWGEGTSGQSTYRFRIDQSFNFIANSSSTDVFTLFSATGNITTAGSITFNNNSVGVITRQILARDTNGLTLKTTGGTEALSIDNSANVNVPNGTIKVAGTTVIDNARKFYPVNIQSSGALSFLNGSGGTSGSSAQGISVRDLYAGTTYANRTGAAGTIDALNGFKVAGTNVIDSARNLTNIAAATIAGNVLINGAHDNNGNAKLSVESGSSYPQISLYSDQVQLGNTSMNYNFKIHTDGSGAKLTAWNSDITIGAVGSNTGSASARDIIFKPQISGTAVSTERMRLRGTDGILEIGKGLGGLVIDSGGNKETVEGRRYNWYLAGMGTQTDYYKIATITIGTGLYKALAMKVTIESQLGNFGNSAYVESSEMNITYYRSGGTQDDVNNATVLGENPTSHTLRVMKTATGTYELQIKQDSSYRDAIVKIQVLSSNGGSIAMSDGFVVGSSSGTEYTPSRNTNAKNLFPGVIKASTFEGNLTGNVTGTATGLSGTPNISVGTIGSGAITLSNRLIIDPSGAKFYDNNTNGNSKGFRIGGGGLVPVNGSGTDTNNIVDIGTTSHKFKNLHLSGTISSGAITTSGTFTKTFDVGNSITLGNDGTFGTSGTGRYVTLGFSGTGNGASRIFSHNTGQDSIYLAAATGHGVIIRANGSGTNHFRFTSTGTFQVNNTTVLNQSRDLTNIASITVTGQSLVASGAVSAPSYAFSNDSDTGVSRPTTNALNFITGGVEQMRIDSSGNVGIGCTPVNSGQYKTLDIRATNGGQILLGRSAQFDFFAFSSSSSTSIGTAVGQDLIFRTNSNGGNNERMRIDSSGNVGIGTSSLTNKFHVSGNARIEGNLMAGGSAASNVPARPIHVKSSGDNAAIRIEDSTSSNLSYDIRSTHGTGLLFVDATAGATRMTITSSGAIKFNNAYTFPTSDGSSGQVLQTDGSGGLTFASVAGGTGKVDIGSGFANNRVLTAANSDTAQGESTLTYDGNVLALTGSPTADLALGTYGTTNQGILYLRGSTANKQSVIKTTNGNLHIDSNSGNNTYLNFYTGSGTYFGGGAGNIVAVMGADGDLWKGSADNSGSKYWHAGNDGAGSGLDADTVDGVQLANLARTDVAETFTNNVSVEGNLYIGAGSNDGYFYSDINGRTAFRSGDFYIQDTVTNYYNYATNQYYGDSSGDNIHFRGNVLNGTGWSIDGAGKFSTRDIQLAAGYHLQRSDHHSGHFEGSYNNIAANGSKSNPIYTIGSGYNPTDAALSNMYGIGFCKSNAGFITGDLDAGGTAGWGLYVAADGDARIFLNGTSGTISTTGQHYVGSNVVWNAGNDGAGSGLDADTLDALQVHTTQGTQNTANTIVRTQANGYTMLGWINTTSGVTTGMDRIYASNDGYIRYVTKATFGAGIGPHISYNDITNKPTIPSLSGYATESYVTTQVNNLIDSAPGALNTLNELAAAMGDDANFSTTVTNSIATKLPLAGGTLTGTLTTGGNIAVPSNTGLSTTGDWVKMTTNHGYIQIGPANTGHAHIYTDRSNFYFNKTLLYASGNLMWHAGNDGSGSTLDADLLDGQQGSYYAPKASPTFTGTVTLPSTVNGPAHDNTLTGVTTGWHTIASFGGSRSAATIEIYDSESSRHNFVKAEVGWSYGHGSINILNATRHGSRTIARMRLMYNTGDQTYGGARLEVYLENWTSGHNLRLRRVHKGGRTGWGNITFAPSSGSVSGYAQYGQVIEIGSTIKGTMGTSGKLIAANGIDLYNGSQITFHTAASDGISTERGFIDAEEGGHLRIATSGGEKIVFQDGGLGGDTNFTIEGDGTLRQGTSNLIWHAGNDGSGSGLDADTLDGINSSSFVRSDAADTLTGALTLNVNGNAIKVSSAAPQIWFNDTDHYDHWIHVNSNRFYVLSDRNGDGSWETPYPMELDSGSNIPYLFGNKAWTAGNDGSGSGLDADTLDGVNSASFARVDSGSTYSNYGNLQRFYSNTNMTSTSGSQASLECFSQGAGNDAFMAFHVGSDYAMYFGLDGGTNKLSVGGWSLGANSYEIYHSGNKPSLATLGFTGASNANYITNNNQLTNGAGFQTTSGNVRTLNTYMGSADSSSLQYWQASGQNSNYAPSGDWYNTLRLGHGNPQTYYSNTLAIKMTGTAVGDLYTQTLSNGTFQGWNKHWHANNDGSGSGLDADTVDGIQASALVGTHNGHNRTIQAEVGALHFYADGGNSGQSGHAYAIFQESGAWSSPFPDLRIAYHTGIKIGGHYSYGGTRFYNDYTMATEIMSIGNGDNHVRLAGSKKLLFNGTSAYGIGAGGHNYNSGYFDTVESGSSGDPLELVYYQGRGVNIGQTASLKNLGCGGIKIGGADNSIESGFMLHLTSTTDAAILIEADTDNVTESDNPKIKFRQDGGAVEAQIMLTANNDFLIDQLYSGEDILFGFAGVTKGTMTNAGNLTMTGDVTAFSDERFKTNIETLDGKKALQMRGVTFEKDGKQGSGVIAQELEKIAPELVHTSDDDMQTKSVAYGNLAGYLIEAIKDQQAMIEELQKEIKELKNVL